MKGKGKRIGGNGRIGTEREMEGRGKEKKIRKEKKKEWKGMKNG